MFEKIFKTGSDKQFVKALSQINHKDKRLYSWGHVRSLNYLNYEVNLLLHLTENSRGRARFS